MENIRNYQPPQLEFDFSSKPSRLYRIKEYLESKFIILTDVRGSKLIVNTSGCNIVQLKNTIEYFLTSESEYILKINDYSHSILSIDQIRIYLSTNTNTLLEINSNLLLDIYGSSFNVVCVYNYIYQIQIDIDQMTNFKLTKSQKNFVKTKKADLNILSFIEFAGKSKYFFYRLLNDINHLFNQIELINIDKLSLQSTSQPWEDDIDTHAEENNDKPHLAEINILDNSPALTSLKNFNPDSPYRPVYIDGQNVAYEHGKHSEFSVPGIKLALDYFTKKGHTEVYVLIPRHHQWKDNEILSEMQRDKKLSFTPSRIVNNKRETAYDDRLILDAALASDGVVVSNDQFRDLAIEDKYVDLIQNRLLPYVFVGDIFMIPEDPRGKNGPTAENILLKKSRESELNVPTHNRRSHHAPVNAPNNLLNRSKKTKGADKYPNDRAHSNKAPHSNFYDNSRSHSSSGNFSHNRSNSKQGSFNGKKHQGYNDNYPLNRQQQKMYDSIKDVLPEEDYRKSIRQVIIGNPKVNDPNILVDLIMQLHDIH